MGVALGGVAIRGVRFGNQNISKIYKGTSLIFQDMDPDAAAYIAHVEAADGQALEPIVKSAIEGFVIGCKADASPNVGVSNWDAIKTGCLMAGARSLSGALVPIKGEAPTNVNFVSVDYIRTTGILSDGNTKSLNTNRNNADDPQNNSHMCLHVTGVGAKTSVCGWIASFGSGVGSRNIGRANVSNIYFRGLTSSSNSFSGIPTGMVGMSRNLSTSFRYIINNTEGPISGPSSTPVSEQIDVFKRGTLHGEIRASFYSLGEAVDLIALKNRVVTYMNEISGI